MDVNKINKLFGFIVCFTAIAGTGTRIIYSYLTEFGFTVFFYFTIQSNILVCIFMLMQLLNKKQKTSKLSAVHGAIVLYILITGIIYNTMLAPGMEAEGLNLITLTTNHTITPILFFINWLVNRKKGLLRWKFLGLWLIYPILYLAVASIEGKFTGEFRYPFLDFLHQTTPIYATGLAIVISTFVLIGSLIIWIDKKLVKQLHKPAVQ